MAKRITIIIASVIVVALLCAAGFHIYFLLKYPYYNTYRKDISLNLQEAFEHLGRPTPDIERILALSVLSDREMWSEMDGFTAEDRRHTLGTYYYNLSNAMRGSLADKLMAYYQPFSLGLFPPVDENASKLAILAAGDVWFELGDMTMAEHSAILSLAFSPKHKGNRYYRRLAEINLINGDEEAAAKYLRELLKDKHMRKWAEARMPGLQTPEVKAYLEYRRQFTPKKDSLHFASDARASLRNLLEANPDNRMAREYLLCYDLLTKDLESFYTDYDPTISRSRLYDEAILICLASKNLINQETVDYYNIGQKVGEEFGEFTEIFSRDGGKGTNLVGKYGKTYWFFYKYAVRNEKN